MTQLQSPAAVAELIVAAHKDKALTFAMEVVCLISKREVLNAVVAACEPRHAHAVRQEFSTLRVDQSTAIITAVCNRFSVSEEEMFSQSKVRHICQARRMCWALLRERLRRSSKAIADLTSHDHSSVLQAYKRLDRNSPDWIALNEQLDRLDGITAEAAE